MKDLVLNGKVPDKYNDIDEFWLAFKLGVRTLWSSTGQLFQLEVHVDYTAQRQKEDGTWIGSPVTGTEGETVTHSSLGDASDENYYLNSISIQEMTGDIQQAVDRALNRVKHTLGIN